MNIVKTLLTGVALACALSAQAADQTVSFSGNVASFDSTPVVLAGGDDVITFQGLASGTYNFVLTMSGQGINLSAATLNGQSGTLLKMGKFTFVGIEGISSPGFALTLTGNTLAGKIPVYSGELTVAAIPEPASMAMLAAGLLTCGFVAYRRKG